MISALGKKLLRDLWRMRGQAVAIAVVIACGVTIFTMALNVRTTLKETQHAYYERYDFAGAFAQLKRAPLSTVDKLSRIDGVRHVATRIVKNVILDIDGFDEPAVARLISLPSFGHPKLNGLHLISGRLPEPGRPDEIVINRNFAEAHGFRGGEDVGALINGTKRRLEIVGVALSPEFIYAIAPGALMPDDERYAQFWMRRDNMEAAFDLESAFNDVSFSLDPYASIPEVLRRIDQVLDKFGGTGAYARSDQISHWFLEGEIQQLAALSTILPPIFMAVAVFLLSLSATRLIQLEREQIGMLKAFGYRDFEVGWHYLQMILAITSIGVAIGWVGGVLFGRQVAELFAKQYHFPFLEQRVEPSVMAASLLMSLLAASLGTLHAVMRAVRLEPATAMRPAPPTSYRGTGIAGSAHLDQMTVIILRNIARFPVRAGLTSLGIALATGVLLMSLHWLEAIEEMVRQHFYGTERQDITLTFAELRPRSALAELLSIDGVVAAEPFRVVPVRMRNGPIIRDEALLGVSGGATLNRLLDAAGRSIDLPDEGIVMSHLLSQKLGVRPGDMIDLEIREGKRQKVRVHLTATIETPLGMPTYASLQALLRLLREGDGISGAYLQIEEPAEFGILTTVKELPAIGSVTTRSSVMGKFRQTIEENMDIMIGVYVLLGSVMVFGVVYNITRIALSERGRELGSLRVLGFSQAETCYVLLGEIALLTLIALPLGCVIGYGLTAMVTEFMLTNEVFRVPLYIPPVSYGWAIVVTTVSAALSGYFVWRRIGTLDLVSVLKTKE